MKDEDKKKRVASLLNQTRLDLSNQRGYVVTASEFARWLGISGSSLSQYISGDQVPTGTNQYKLAAKLGRPFMDAMDLPYYLTPDDPLFRYIADHWGAVDNDTQLRIVELVEGKTNATAPAIA